MLERLRFVVTGSDNLQQWWQAELLLHTYRKFHPETPLTILWACKNPLNPKFLPNWPDYYTTPLYENLGDEIYTPMNRITGIDVWLQKNNIKEEYICFIDPDMLFLRKITSHELLSFGLSKCHLICGRDIWREPLINKQKSNGIFAVSDPNFVYQTYEHFAKNKTNIEKIPPSIVPVFSHIDDLRCIADQWTDLTKKIHLSPYKQWTSELYAFDLICHDSNINVFATPDLYHTSQHAMIATAPFLHYFARFENADKTWHFDKHEWRKIKPIKIRFPLNISGMAKYFADNMIERFNCVYRPIYDVQSFY